MLKTDVVISGDRQQDNEIRQAIRKHGFIRTYVEYAIAWTILKSLVILPRRVALRFGRGVGRIVQLVIPRLSRNADINLRLALPELNPKERAGIITGVFQNLGRLLGEVSQFPKLDPENISSVVVCEGIENYLEAKDRNRGVILLTGHIGAWELSVYAHAINGYPMSFLARKVDNPLVDRLAESLRSLYGNQSIDKKNSLREVVRTLRSGEVIGILADLNASPEEGVFCDFFGLPACTTAGVATLAMRTGAIVLPGYIIWDETINKHVLHFDKPIETTNTGNQKEDVIINTARYTKALESVIRRYPDQWLWIHKRWRTRPEGEKGLY